MSMRISRLKLIKGLGSLLFSTLIAQTVMAQQLTTSIANDPVTQLVGPDVMAAAVKEGTQIFGVR